MFKYKNHLVKPLNYGEYQAKNIALALKMYPVSDSIAIKSIESSLWRGRMQRVKRTNMYIDGAHNIDGLKELIKTISKLDNYNIVYAGLGKKDHHKNLEYLSKHCNKITLTKFKSQGIWNLDEYKEYKQNTNLDKLIKDAKQSDTPTFFIGSLHFAGELLKKI